MSENTRRLQELDRRHIWHPFTQMAGWQEEDFPVIVAGEGVYLIDSEGRRYLDGVASLWTNVHGHAFPPLDRAVRDQLDRIAHSTMLGLANEPAIRFAAELAQCLPGDLERIFYSDNGATSVEVAIKIAFAYWRHRGRSEKARFFRFTNSYHGDTIGSVSVGGIELFHSLFHPLLFDAPVLPYPCPPVYPKTTDKEAYAADCRRQIEAALREGAPTAAGVIIEPLMQGAAGMYPAPPGFLKWLRDLCTELDILLIVDEVATGFGRTGRLFACEYENVVPDLMCLAKGITGGYLPLAATAVREFIYEAFLGAFEEYKTFFHGHTYTGNPLACAAASASLRALVQRALPSIEPKLRAFTEITDRLGEIPQVAEVRRVGLMAGAELVADPETNAPYPTTKRMGHRVTLAARQRGAIIRPLGDVIVLMPPLAMTVEEIRELGRIVFEATMAAVNEI